MAKRRTIVDHNRGPFTVGSLVNLGGIPLITAFIMLVGWYFLTSDTLKRHDSELKNIRVETKEKIDDDRRQRENARNEFLENQRKTTEILGKLDSRLAVSETKQEVANQTLSKIADELARINGRGRGR